MNSPPQLRGEVFSSPNNVSNFKPTSRPGEPRRLNFEPDTPERLPKPVAKRRPSKKKSAGRRRNRRKKRTRRRRRSRKRCGRGISQSKPQEEKEDARAAAHLRRLDEIQEELDFKIACMKRFMNSASTNDIDKVQRLQEGNFVGAAYATMIKWCKENPTNTMNIGGRRRKNRRKKRTRSRRRRRKTRKHRGGFGDNEFVPVNTFVKLNAEGRAHFTPLLQAAAVTQQHPSYQDPIRWRGRTLPFQVHRPPPPNRNEFLVVDPTLMVFPPPPPFIAPGFPPPIPGAPGPMPWIRKRYLERDHLAHGVYGEPTLRIHQELGGRVAAKRGRIRDQMEALRESGLGGRLPEDGFERNITKYLPGATGGRRKKRTRRRRR